MSRADSIKTLREQIKDIDIAMLTTVERDGTLRSRPMATQQVEFDGDLWFFTYDSTPKVDEIAQERQVNVAYSGRTSRAMSRSPGKPSSSAIARNSTSSGVRSTRSGSRTERTILGSRY